MVLLLAGMGILGDIGVHSLATGQLTAVCLVPGALSVGGSRQSLTGGKGNLVGVGEWGGASGSEYIRPRVGGKVEKVVSKGGGGGESYSLYGGRFSAVSPLIISSDWVLLPGEASMLVQTTPVCHPAHSRNSSKAG